MRKSVKVRVLIFDILNEIHQKNKNFDDSFLYLTQNLILDERDRCLSRGLGDVYKRQSIQRGPLIMKS